MMGRFLFYQIKQKRDGFSLNPPLLPPSIPISYSSGLSYDNKESASVSASASTSSLSAFDRISPVFLLVIIILAIVFFVSGLLHLLVRFLVKRPVFSAIYHSNRFPETSSGSHNSLQRQLQHLFRQHDSGLDQASIDALPVFYYKDIMGLKEPFDCAVCLYEFSDQDKLRLIPMCSHAFHIDCIDTWLLSNSTCPLCRGTLLGCNTIPLQVPFYNFDVSRQASNVHSTAEQINNMSGNDQRQTITEEGEKRVFSVRLGKFRSLNEEGRSINGGAEEETRSCNLDGRRCYSMGTVRYVVAGDSNLQVALSNENIVSNSGDREVEEGKKIRGRSRGDSFSVSKIWLWSKKSRFPSDHLDVFPLALSLPRSEITTEL